LPFLNDGEISFISSVKSIRRCGSTHFLRRLHEKVLAAMMGGGSGVADLNPSGISGEGRGLPGTMGHPHQGGEISSRLEIRFGEQSDVMDLVSFGGQ